jgi:acyl carrier protein
LSLNSLKQYSSKYPLFRQVQIKSFSTDHKIDEKHSLEYIESGVFEVLKSAAKCKQEKLNRTATLEELGFDSLDIVELVIALEERFSVNISGKIHLI